MILMANYVVLIHSDNTFLGVLKSQLQSCRMLDSREPELPLQTHPRLPPPQKKSLQGTKIGVLLICVWPKTAPKPDGTILPSPKPDVLKAVVLSPQLKRS